VYFRPSSAASVLLSCWLAAYVSSSSLVLASIGSWIGGISTPNVHGVEFNANQSELVKQIVWNCSRTEIALSMRCHTLSRLVSFRWLPHASGPG
jgi:hypothetical protein